MAHTFEELVNMQRAADSAHARVLALLDEYGQPARGDGWTEQQSETYGKAWSDWRKAAAGVQASVTEHAAADGKTRYDVEAAVKKAARHPEPVQP
ncbi:hypothetical protein ABZT17_12150 [Streptomyces sp. NPDC005648]|uniref:hypothetical protein n=1 Tax=Streptomyces sp. NPDC005648 TaxID=3157044 RepID=UPI0033A2D731